jgi:hypothetical protein
MHFYLVYTLEHNIMLTFNLMAVEVYDLEVYIILY